VLTIAPAPAPLNVQLSSRAVPVAVESILIYLFSNPVLVPPPENVPPVMRRANPFTEVPHITAEPPPKLRVIVQPFRLRVMPLVKDTPLVHVELCPDGKSTVSPLTALVMAVFTSALEAEAALIVAARTELHSSSNSMKILVNVCNRDVRGADLDVIPGHCDIIIGGLIELKLIGPGRVCAIC
jgi:hypothetical protein